MRLIDADALIDDIKNNLWDWETVDGITATTVLKQTISDIGNQPTIEERKTGTWNFIGNQMFECSECGTCYTQSQFHQMRVRISDPEFPKFCPNCGDAK